MHTKTALDEHDEGVLIAVRALGDMRNAATRSDPRSPPPLSTSSPSASSDASPRSPASSPTNSSSAVVNSDSRNHHQSDNPTNNTALSTPDFVSRVSHLPLVYSALRVYEQGKASSRVVKYGAEMMESSVKTLSRPVIDRIPPQLDQFACKQLDRLDRYRRPSNSSTTIPSIHHPNSLEPSSPSTSFGDNESARRTANLYSEGSALDDEPELRAMTREDGNSVVGSPRRVRKAGSNVPSWLEASSPFVGPAPRPPDLDDNASRANDSNNVANEQQVAQRSRWQAMLLEAGGLSAALSDENMRRLKYCLQWLQYATVHIDAQILILRDFTASLQDALQQQHTTAAANAGGSNGTLMPPPSSSRTHSKNSSNSGSDASGPTISPAHMRTLNDVRSDIINTIRQVVDVVSKYAGGALPEPARGRVRGFILKLPQRWASRAGGPVGGANGNGVGGGADGSGAGGGADTKERVADRESVAAASGVGVRRNTGSSRRAAHRERGAGGESANGAAGGRSAASSRASSPSRGLASPRLMRPPSTTNLFAAHGQMPAVTVNAAHVAAERVLVLATESLDMMRGVTSVVKESLDKADAWVGRLRYVGIQRGNTDPNAPAGEGQEDADMFPPPSSSERNYPRRNSVSGQTRSRRNSYQYGREELDLYSTTNSTAATNSNGSSVPGTPSPMYASAPGAYTPSSPLAGVANAPSPSTGLGKGFSAMNLNGNGHTGHSSAYSTPRSVVVGLPIAEEGVRYVNGGGGGKKKELMLSAEEEEEENERERERERGMWEVDMERERRQMDVDT